MPLADTAAVAASISRPPSTIRTWAARGLLTRHGKDHHGRTLYDLDEVAALHRSRRAAEQQAQLDKHS